MRRLRRPLAAVAVTVVAGAASVATASPAAAASVRVTPSSGVNPGGQAVSVSGSGFDAKRNNRFGVYVVFGPRNANFSKDANAFAAAVWVHPGGGGGGQAPMSASGAFSVSLNVKAKYTDGNGKSVDCLRSRCYVITMAAHGVPDRSQDTFTPITFKGSNGGSKPGSGSDDSGSGGGGGAAGGSNPTTGTSPATGSGGANPHGSAGATPNPSDSGRPQVSPNGFATPLAGEPFRQTAAGPRAQSPWPFGLAVAAVLVAAVAVRRFTRHRRGAHR